ncbi:MAG: DUF2851 family protein [Flavobacteriales bacterium]
MKEELLHFIWQFRLFDQTTLKTLQGESLEIIKPGKHNRDAGPDFSEALVRIGATTWAGNIELHTKSSDWFSHGHHTDPGYDNVILHVVYSHDIQNEQLSAERPVLVLENKINHRLIAQYQAMMKTRGGIACESLLNRIDLAFVDMYYQRLIAERLEEKSTAVLDILHQNTGDWAETCYILTTRYFGMGINNKPFEQLARSLPLKIIAKHRKSTLQVEALLFGQAGMLHDALHDPYPQALWNEYQYLSKLYNLRSMKPGIWKMMRMRPSNFPTIRLSQLAQLLVKSESLFAKFTETKEIKQLNKLFDTKASAYWEEHFMFDKPAPRQEKPFGKSAKDLMLINVVSPILFAYGLHQDNQEMKDRAVEWLSYIKSESNKVTKIFTKHHLPMTSALDSQACLHLYVNYCEKKHCLQCAIGSHILSK